MIRKYRCGNPPVEEALMENDGAEIRAPPSHPFPRAPQKAYFLGFRFGAPATQEAEALCRCDPFLF